MVEYSKRKLSVKSDKLPALAGLASRFREYIQDDYFAGHWRKWLLLHLLWKCVDEKGSARIPYCPSWSWLSVDGPICVENQASPKIRPFHPQPVAKIINCKTVLRFQNAPCDQMTSGELIIRRYLCAVMVDAKTQKFHLNYPYNVSETEQRFPKITLNDPATFLAATDSKDNCFSSNVASLSTVWCLPLYIARGERGHRTSVVRGITLVKTNRIHYQRVGWFYGSAGWCYRERSKGLQERDILII